MRSVTFLSLLFVLAFSSSALSDLLTIDCSHAGMKHTGTKELVVVSLWSRGRPGVNHYNHTNDFLMLLNNPPPSIGANYPSNKDDSNEHCWMPLPTAFPYLSWFLPDMDWKDMIIKIWMPLGGYTSPQLKRGEGDAMWIDRLMVKTSKGDLSWGRDGGKGYCLSPDVNDTFGSDRQNAPCSPCWVFDVNTGKARHCQLENGYEYF